MRLPTVKIAYNGPGGYRTINERDFDPRAHKKFRGKVETPAPAAPAAPAEVDMSDVEAMSWPDLRSLAADVSDDAIVTKEDAIEAIRAHRAQQAG